MIFTEFKDRVGDIVSGTVRRFDRSDVIWDLGKYEALMPTRSAYRRGISGWRTHPLLRQGRAGRPARAEIILSRADPRFIIKLFSVEVSEISDGTIEIKGIAREPGFRTKMAVYSRDSKVDPVVPVSGCVGPAREKTLSVIVETMKRWTSFRGRRTSRPLSRRRSNRRSLKVSKLDERGKRGEVFRGGRPVVAGHRQARAKRAAHRQADRLGSGH